MHRLTHDRMKWGLFALLAGLLLAGLGCLCACLRPYWIARFCGRGADLRGAQLLLAPLASADLLQADLRGAVLGLACLRGANLHGANLQHADLFEAVLREANLAEADLTGTNLCDHDLRRANLRGAILTGVDIVGSNLEGADLRAAHLEHAMLGASNLRAADLRETDLTHTALTDAIYDARTRWPAGFDPTKRGAVKAAVALRRDVEHSGNTTPPTVAQIKRCIASAIPSGADVSTVVSFLRKNRIEHSGYEPRTRQVDAIIRIQPRGWLAFEGAVCMHFRFNSQRKLADYSVSQQWIAP